MTSISYGTARVAASRYGSNNFLVTRLRYCASLLQPNPCLLHEKCPLQCVRHANHAVSSCSRLSHRVQRPATSSHPHGHKHIHDVTAPRGATSAEPARRPAHLAAPHAHTLPSISRISPYDVTVPQLRARVHQKASTITRQHLQSLCYTPSYESRLLLLVRASLY